MTYARIFAERDFVRAFLLFLSVGLARLVWEHLAASILGGRAPFRWDMVLPLPSGLYQVIEDAVMFSAEEPSLVLFALGYVALVLLQVAVAAGFLYRHLIISRRPAPAPATTGTAIDWPKLHRPFWQSAAVLSLCVLVTVLIGMPLVGGAENGTPLFAMYMSGDVGGVALIGAAICALGIGGGLLRMSSAKASMGKAFGTEELPADHPLTRRVHHYAQAMGLPLPAVGIIAQTNAYAAGSRIDDAMVVIGVPLVQQLTRPELDAVICHELGHIASGDMRRMETADGFNSAAGWVVALPFKVMGLLSHMPANAGQGMYRQLGMMGQAFAFLTRTTVLLLGELATRAMSRRREFHADAIAAAMVSPAAMTAALRKLAAVEAAPGDVEMQFKAMMIRPRALGRILGAVVSTHPSFAARIDALERGEFIARLPKP